MTAITLSNWWCPKCERFVASADLTTESRVHRECRTKCEWRKSPLVFSMEGESDD